MPSQAVLNISFKFEGHDSTHNIVYAATAITASSG